MTEQFDEGVKEIVMALLAVTATAYKADDIKSLLDTKPEPIEQKIQAVKIADSQINSPSFDAAAEEVLQTLQQDDQQAETQATPEQPEDTGVLVKGKLPLHFHIMNRLTESGLTTTAAIGIVANLKAESNLDPTLKQIAYWKKDPKTGKKTIPVIGRGRGLAQWEKGGRFDTDRINLLKFAEKSGTDWTDLDTQVDFIIHEMTVHPEYKRVKDMLNKAQDIEEATMIFLTKYEKAGKPHTSNRLKYAQDMASVAGL